MSVPAAMPAPVVARLHEALLRRRATAPTCRRASATSASRARPGRPPEFQAFVAPRERAVAAADPRARHPAGRLTRGERCRAAWPSSPEPPAAARMRRGIQRVAAPAAVAAETCRPQAREEALLRWDMKVLASEIARQRYAAGLAGRAAPLPEKPVPDRASTSRVCRQADIEHAWLRHWCGRLAHGAALSPQGVGGRLRRPGAVGGGDAGAAAGAASASPWGGNGCPPSSPARGSRWWRPTSTPATRRARDWVDSGQHAAGARPAVPAAPGRRRRRSTALVTHRAADMAAIPPDLMLGGFDFVWSVCSLEHLGSLEAGERFVMAAMRCLKPGGIAVHTTEYNLDATGPTLEDGPTVLYQRAPHRPAGGAAGGGGARACCRWTTRRARPGSSTASSTCRPSRTTTRRSDRCTRRICGCRWTASRSTSVGIVAKAGPAPP